MHEGSSIADRQYTHHDAEVCILPGTPEDHDIPWGASEKSYWKLKPRVKVVVAKQVVIHDGCSRRGGFMSKDGRLFALACEIPVPETIVVLEPAQLYPFYFWKVLT